MNHFDQASRLAAKLQPTAFVSWLLNIPLEQFTFRNWLDTRQLSWPGSSDSVSDTVARLDNRDQGGVPWIVVIEFQARPDPGMSARLIVYAGKLLLDCRPDTERGSRYHVGAAVVNLTGKGQTSRTMDWSSAGLRMQLQAVERNLETESAADLLDDIESGKHSRVLLPWIPLMKGGGESDTVERWKRLAEAETDRELKSTYAVLALVFAEKSPDQTLWQQKLEGWNVEESTYLNSWIAKGEERGEERGIAIGEERGIQSSIIRLGCKQFGEPSEATAAAIRAVSDHSRLDRILDRVFDAVSWDDLLTTP